jgi:hypothetical protein
MAHRINPTKKYWINGQMQNTCSTWCAVSSLEYAEQHFMFYIHTYIQSKSKNKKNQEQIQHSCISGKGKKWRFNQIHDLLFLMWISDSRVLRYIQAKCIWLHAYVWYINYHAFMLTHFIIVVQQWMDVYTIGGEDKETMLSKVFSLSFFN